MTTAKRTYKVTAATGFRGHQQGDQFDAELTEQEERRAVERGSIRVVNKTTKEGKSDA